MDSIELRACAKLNLSLDVTGKRPDGFHEMKMVMTSIALCDELTLRLTDDGAVRARCSLPYVPTDESNLACSAARLFLDRTGHSECGAELDIRKRIPVGAGMAGGSTDAAAVLRGLNALFGMPLDAGALAELGGELGSDVPYCLAGGTVLATGRGEVLSPLPPLPDCAVVVCKPGFPISTPMLFSRLDLKKLRCRPDTEALCAALADGDLPRLARRMYNIFEDVLPRRCAAVGEIKARLLDLGALGAVMTGTGSAVFGLFDDEAAARRAFDALRPDYRDCFLTRPASGV